MILLCALVILIPGQFYVIDATARKWTDVIWSGTDWARKLDTHKANRVYYSIAAAYVTYGLIAFAIPGLSASKMMVIGGSLANLSIAITMIHALLVNRRFLPRSLHPTPLKQALLILSIAFFLVMFGLVVNQKILPLIGFKTV